MGGKGSGPRRKNKTTTEAKISMSKLDPIAVALIEETIRGINKDRLKYEAATEVYRHNHGNPKQAQDLRIKGVMSFTADELLLMVRPQVKLLREGDANRTGEEGLSTQLYEETETTE